MYNAKSKKPFDTLIIELIVVVGLVYVFCLIFFKINLKAAIRYYEAGQYELAVDKFTKLAGVAPVDPAIFYRLAVSYSRLGQHNLAIPYYLSALFVKKPSTPLVFYSHLPAPSYVEVYDGLVVSSFALGQFDNAIIYCQQLLRYNSRDAKAYKMLGIIYHSKALQTGEEEYSRAALRFMQKSLDLDPNIMNEEDMKILQYFDK